MIYAGRNFRAVGDILVSPNTFQQNGKPGVSLSLAYSHLCVREREMRVNKLESRSCNNMPRYSLLMPIGDSVSLVYLVCVFLFLWVPVIDACDHEFLCCVSGLSVHVCLWACALRMLTVHTSRVCMQAASLWIILVGSKCFFLMLSWSASYLILSRWNCKGHDLWDIATS